MTDVAFAKFINSNKRDTDQLHQIKKKGGEKGKMAGAQIAFNVPYVKMFYAPIHYEKSETNPNPFFTKEALENSLKKFSDKQDTSKFGIRTATFDATTKTYIFMWMAYPDAGWRGKRYVNEASRKHIKDDLLNFMGQKPKKGKEKIIGAHVEASALLSILRKAVYAEVISQEEADRYLHAFMEGNLHEVLTSEKGKELTKDIKDQNIMTVTSEDEIGMSYEEVKRINEATHIVGLKTELMFPQPSGANSNTLNTFEEKAFNGVKAEIEGIAHRKGIEYIEVEGSISTVGMYQEIIAAKLLGKKAPKYNTKHKAGKKKVKTGSTTGKTKIPKGKSGKRATSQVEKAKFQHQLRNAAGQFANPTALRALLNKKLPNKLIGNMGYPSLKNITGRFAESVKIINITHGNRNARIPTVQYTYDTDPYQVFEMGGKGDSRWATQARDPRFIIDNTIREIAAEMMITKFNTQRL